MPVQGLHLSIPGFGTDMTTVIIETEVGFGQEQAPLFAQKTAGVLFMGPLLNDNTEKKVDKNLESVGVVGHQGTAAAASGSCGAMAAKLIHVHGSHMQGKGRRGKA